MSEHAAHGSNKRHGSTHQNQYRRLAIMTVLSFIAMYVLMYAMVNRLENVVSNFNQLYMAGLMTGAMVLIELVVMSGMYENKKLNAVLASLSVALLVGCFVLIRQQTAISDRQFLRSMIPHHAGAILMCQRAPIHDAEIQKLCQSITLGQQAEINQMKTKLRDLSR